MRRRESVIADYRKWPHARHYRFLTERLGEDAHGVWLGMRLGTAFDGPRQGTFATDNVLLVPGDGWWTAKFRPPAYEALPLYVDICAPPRWEGGRLVAIDLDLDVIRLHDGQVVIDDQDEFERNRVELAYPDWLADGAVRAAEEIAAAVRNRREPFGTACQSWLSLLASGDGEHDQ